MFKKKDYADFVWSAVYYVFYVDVATIKRSMTNNTNSRF